MDSGENKTRIHGLQKPKANPFDQPAGSSWVDRRSQGVKLGAGLRTKRGKVLAILDTDQFGDVQSLGTFGERKTST